MVLRGWGARVCALRKSRTRAREPGGGSRPGLLSLGHHHCLPPLSLAARRSIRLPRTCRAPLCLICPQVVWWRWRWWRRRAAHHSLALALAVSLSLDLSLDLSLSRPLSPSLQGHSTPPMPPRVQWHARVALHGMRRQSRPTTMRLAPHTSWKST